MVSVAELPNSSLPLNQLEDKLIVTQNNRLTKLSVGQLSADLSSTIDHDLLFNYNPLQHIDWTGTTYDLVTTGTISGSNISGTNTGDQNVFETFRVLGDPAGAYINAQSTADTFTFVPGSNVTITTDPNTRELFISVDTGPGYGIAPIGIGFDTYTPDGINDTFPLSVTPSDKDQLLVFFDGVYQGAIGYSLVGSDIVFNSPPPAYISKIDVYIYDDIDLVLSRDSRLRTVDYNTGDTSITLGGTPQNLDYVLIFFDGVFQGTPNYSVVGTTVNFVDPIPAGVDRIDYIIFEDTGANTIDIDVSRQIYQDGINYTAGLTNILVLPSAVDSPQDLLIFFDGAFLGQTSYTVNNAVVTFASPIPSFTKKVEILTLTGQYVSVAPEAAYGIITVAGQPDVIAAGPGDSVEFIAGTNIDITTDNTLKTVQFDFNGTLGDPDQNIFSEVQVGGVTNFTAATTTSAINFVGGTDIDVVGNGTDTLTINFTGAAGSPDQNLFNRIQIDGLDQFTAGTTTDPINFEQGSNITLTNPSPNTIRIDAAGGAAGESNTSSSSGLGQSIVLPKVGVDLPFKGIDAGDANVSVTSNATDVLVGLNIATLEGNLNHDNLTGFVANEHIDWTAATQNLNTTGTITGSNLSGTNTGDQNLFSTVTADVGTTTADVLTDTLNIVGGTNIDTAIVGDTLTINATGIASGEANTSSNVGGFAEVALPKVGVDLPFRTFQSSDSSLTITQNVNDLDFVANEANIDHDALLNFVANEHIDWTSATQNLNTTGTISGSNLSGTNTGDQNLWATVAGDAGSTTADVLTDTITIAGAGRISTAVVADVLTVSTTAEANTASNQGGFSPLFIQKTGEDLEFRTIQSSDSSITITQNAQDLDLTLPAVPGTLNTFVSTDEIITSGGQVVLAHGLGARPTYMQPQLVCQVAEFGYAIGDVVNINYTMGRFQEDQGVSIVADNTNLRIRYGLNSSSFMALDKTTGDGRSLSNGNWLFRITASTVN